MREKKKNACIPKKVSREENSKTSQNTRWYPLSSPWEVERGSSIQMHPRSLTIRNDITYVDAFGDTGMQFNGERAIHMGLLDVVRTSSSYSQLGWVVHFLQNFLTRSIVMLTSLPVRAAKVVIDIRSRRRAIVCQSAISGTFKNMSRLNARAPGVVPNVVATVTCMACIAVAKAGSTMSLA